eukprot:scaffold145004_cov202-Phaeocystis_antarctica.AAC.1
MPSEELGPASSWAEPSAGQRERRNRAAHARRASRRGCSTAWSGGVAVDVAKSDVTPKESVWPSPRRWNRARSRRCTSASLTWS